MPAKPLHVQVAEALGCHVRVLVLGNGTEYLCDCAGRDHGVIREEGPTPSLLRYDTDWSATGPLIERFSITLTKAWPEAADPWHACTESHFGSDDASLSHDRPFVNSGGNTCLIAVCHLILALHKAGKLPKQEEQVVHA